MNKIEKTKERKKVGRKALPEGSKRVRVEIFVMGRCKEKFIKECLVLREKCEKEVSEGGK